MKKRIVFILLILTVLGAAGAVVGYNLLFGNRIQTGGTSKVLYISSSDDYDAVMTMLNDSLQIKNPYILDWVARQKSYPSLIKSGRYEVSGDISYVGLVDMLRAGNQKPVNVTYNNIRTLYDLAGKVGTQIQADSTDIINFLLNPGNYQADGFTKETIISVFIPNTYEFFWDTSAEEFYKRMLVEYNKFWNDKRKAQAKAKNLTPVEVAILASIIDDEVVKVDEKPRIAGVYLNRLKSGMPLQACPTIKFALNDFTITRVLNKHLVVDSPYNTYKYRGLPPGPIGCPTIDGIEAVLNAEQHNYIFFAAKADFSGYHNFSRTLREHNRYANEYQRELDKRKIFK